MNQGQFTALIEQLQLLNKQLGEVLDSRPHVIVIRGDADPLAILRALSDLGYPPATGLIFEGQPAAETATPQGAGLDPSCRTDPDPAPVDELRAAPRKFKKAKGGG